MRLGSRAFWLGTAVGFIGAVVALIVLSAAVFLVPGSGRAGQSIHYKPIPLEQAHQLIETGQVYLVAIRREGNIDEYFPFQEVAPGHFEEPDLSLRWNVNGVDVHVFTESMSTGVPLLSSETEDEVGLNSEQFDDLLQRIDTYNTAASTPAEVLDQRD